MPGLQMGSNLGLRPPSSSLCQRGRHLLYRRNRSQSFTTSAPAASDKYNIYADSLKRGGVLGPALSASKSQAQSMRDIQQQKQREGALARQQHQQQGSSPLSALSLSPELMEATRSARDRMQNRPASLDAFGELHHLHIYATKHNTHITLTRPNREPMLSLSAGNINFRKGQRGSFDAAYQLITYSIAQIIEKGFMQKIKGLEVVMRGYGPGREAFQKVLLGTEGRLIKSKVHRVTDSTRLKFGGTRSPNVRRL